MPDFDDEATGAPDTEPPDLSGSADVDETGALIKPTVGGIEEFPGIPADEPDLSQSSGDPADNPDAQREAAAAGADQHDDANQPAIPPPITPDMQAQQRQRRVNFEREINDRAEFFAADARATFIEHALEGRDVRLVPVNADGSEYTPDDDDTDSDDADGELALPVLTEDDERTE